MGYFAKDRSEFKDEYKLMVIGQNEVKKIINKLCRRFKLPKVDVVFNKRKPDGGTYWYPRRTFRMRKVDNRCTIGLHKEVFSIGTIIHEVGHHMDFVENGSPKSRRWHSNKLLTKMRRLARYCKRMGYWGWVMEK